MKKTLMFLLIFLATSSVCFASRNKVFNPFTSKPDYIGVDVSGDVTLVCDSGQVLTTTGAGVWACAPGGSQWTTSGTAIYYNTGNVVIGNTGAGRALLDVYSTGVANPNPVMYVGSSDTVNNQIKFGAGAVSITGGNSTFQILGAGTHAFNATGLSMGGTTLSLGGSVASLVRTGGSLGGRLTIQTNADDIILAPTQGAVGVNKTTKINTFSVQPVADHNINGTTTTNASTTIAGTSTKFTTDLGVGDRISLSSATTTYATVTAITNDTSLTVASALGDGTSQTIKVKRAIFSLFDSAGNLAFFVSDLGNAGFTAGAVTIANGATTFGVTRNVMTVTGDAGGNTIATITGGVSGQTLTLIFVDALVTITDTAAATLNTVNLSAAFTSTANDTMTLVYDGNKWFETARSVN